MSAEAKAKFERWHLRQRELGACRCKECMAALPQRPGVEFRTDPVIEITVIPEEMETARGIGFSMADPHRPVEGSDECSCAQNGEERADAAYLKEVAAIGPPEPGEPDRRPYRDAYASWGKLAKEAGAGSYDRNHEALLIYEKKLEARENEVIARQYRADDRECRAEKARLTYEQARARLDAEFGADVVGKSLAALERILALHAEFAELGEQVEDITNSVATVHSAVDDLNDESSILVERFGKLMRKIRGENE